MVFGRVFLYFCLTSPNQRTLARVANRRATTSRVSGWIYSVGYKNLQHNMAAKPPPGFMGIPGPTSTGATPVAEPRPMSPAELAVKARKWKQTQSRKYGERRGKTGQKHRHLRPHCNRNSFYWVMWKKKLLKQLWWAELFSIDVKSFPIKLVT